MTAVPQAPTPEPIDFTPTEHATVLLERMNRSWQDINALSVLVSTIGEHAPADLAPTDAADLVWGLGAVARVIQEKAETVDRNARALYQAFRLQPDTGSAR